MLLTKPKYPMVSVIIPVYNGEDNVGRAIESVLNQTFEDFELIIIDDASTDNTFKTITSYKDERIVIVKHNKNTERSISRNDGISLSKGKYIAFLDHDDEWLTDKLEKQINYFKQLDNSFGLVYTGYYQINDIDSTAVISPFLSIAITVEGNMYSELIRGDVVLPSTVLIKKEILIKTELFDERLAGPEAWELWLRISKITKFGFIKEPLVKRFIHGENTIMKINNPIEEEKVMDYINKRHPEIKKVKNKWFQNNFSNFEDFIKFLQNTDKPVVIFGASSKGKAVLNWLKQEKIKCDFFVDNDRKKMNTKVMGVEVKDPSTLKGDEVVLISSSWAREIIEQIRKLGVEKYVIM